LKSYSPRTYIRIIQKLIFLGFFSILIAISLVVGIYPKTVSALDSYNCGTYSSASYGNVCPENNVPQAASPSFTNVDNSEPASLPKVSTYDYINLNELAGYRDIDGVTLDLPSGQIIHFELNGEQHTVTLKTINDSFVVVTIASEPVDVTIQRGTTIEYDVNKDKIADIAIRYMSVTEKGAGINFRQLYPAVVPLTSDTGDNFWIKIWPIFAISGILIISITVVVIRMKKK